MSVTPTRLQFKDTKTPYSAVFDDVYFANAVGVEESLYVYIEGSGVGEAIRSGKENIQIGEVGFGVGLNFLLTLREFLAHANLEQHLHYVSVEKFPVEVEDLWTLYRAYPELLPVAELLLSQYPVLTPGLHRLHFAEHRLTLDLILGDASECFSKHDFKVDYWYWDGFAPSKNPDAFSETLFAVMSKRSNRGARGTSFTAAGWVRRSLESKGFQVSKKPGFGKKRECIEGVFVNLPAAESDPHPWFSRENFCILKNKSERIAVIGAGLAGSAIARALANRGHAVCVFDASGIASNASSNSVGLYNVQLSKKQNPISRYSQAALTYFLRELNTLKVPHGLGITRMDPDAKACLVDSAYPESFYETHEKGVTLPFCGIVNPQTLCQMRMNHPLIQFRRVKVKSTKALNGRHSLSDEHGQNLGEFDHVVFALGDQTELLSEVPIRSIRGQTLLIRPTELSKLLSSARVEDGYVTPIAPAITGHSFHVLGATYQAKEILTNQEEVDTHQLIDEAKIKWPFFSALQLGDVASSKIGFRASTPDKMPLIGPLFLESFLSQNYMSALRGGGSKNLPPLSIQPGAWILMGLGSRGITFSSLGAEILASLMMGQSLPIEGELFAHLHPVRFTVRKLRKT